jgi:hypothetical protein
MRIIQAGQGGGNSVAVKRFDSAYNAANRVEEINSLVDGLTTYAHDFTGKHHYTDANGKLLSTI